MTSVFVFNGSHAVFPCAVFTDRQRAISWIARRRLTGTLTEYPVDVGAYDWAVDNGYFQPRREDQRTPQFIGGFTSSRQWHAHFVDGTGGCSADGEA